MRITSRVTKPAMPGSSGGFHTMPTISSNPNRPPSFSAGKRMTSRKTQAKQTSNRVVKSTGSAKVAQSGKTHGTVDCGSSKTSKGRQRL